MLQVIEGPEFESAANVFGRDFIGGKPILLTLDFFAVLRKLSYKSSSGLNPNVKPICLGEVSLIGNRPMKNALLALKPFTVMKEVCERNEMCGLNSVFCERRAERSVEVLRREVCTPLSADR